MEENYFRKMREEKDSGVYFTKNLNFEKYIDEIVAVIEKYSLVQKSIALTRVAGK